MRMNLKKKSPAVTGKSNCTLKLDMLPLWHGTIVLQGVLTSFFDRMGVMLMKFDFKDLMTFGLFLLALLTFVFTFSK